MNEREPLVIEHATVFPATGSARLVDATVVIENGRFSSIGPSETVQIPRGSSVIDASEKTVIPGLIDMHAHLKDGLFPLFLAAGVTTVKDVGNHLERVSAWRDAEASEELLSPRIRMCGPLLEGDPPMWPDISEILLDGPSASSAVDRLAAAGVDALKIYMRLTAPVMGPLIERAHHHQLPVTGHLGRVPTAEAIELGIDGLEHAPQGLYSEVVPTHLQRDADERITLGQSTFWARFLEGWTAVDPDGPDVRQMVDLMVERDVFLVTTLVTFDRMFGHGAEKRQTAPGVEHVPDDVSRRWEDYIGWFTEGWTETDFEVARQAMDTVGAVVAALHAAGGRVVAGTDAPAGYAAPGFSLHRELELLVDAGLSTADALLSATSAAAAALHADDEVGTVEPGKLADCVIVNGDPLADIREMRNIALVVKGGQMWEPGQLLSADIPEDTGTHRRVPSPSGHPR